AGVGDLGGHVGILLGKVLGEHIGQLVGLLVVGCLVLPHAAGVQHLGGHAGAAGGVVHVEHIVVLELHIVKAAVQGCGDHGAGVAQLHPLGACGGAAAGPAGDRKSTRLNSSHVSISYAVFCLKKKTSNSALSLRINV